MSKVSVLILGALVWAALLILSSWTLRGNPAGDWVDAALYVLMGTFLAMQSQRCLRRPAPAGA